MKNSIKETYYRKHKIIFFFIITGILLFNVSPAYSSEEKIEKTNQKLLETLDSIIVAYPSIISAKESSIKNMKKMFEEAVTPLEKFQLSRQLYSEYQVFDSDSALYYATQAINYLNDAGIDDYNLQSRVKIDQAFSQVVQGKFNTAKDNLESINPERLDLQTKLLFYQVSEYIYSLQSIYFDNYKEDKKLALKASGELMDSINKLQHPEQYVLPWVPVAYKVILADNEGKIKLTKDDEEFLALKEIVDSQEPPSRKAATNAYWLACYYRNMGDREMRIKYLTIAAIYDALIANREISALEELASVLLEKEDIDRAFNYISFALDEVSLYKNSARMGSMSKVLNMVRTEYEKDIRERDRRLHNLVVALVIVASILLISLFILLFAYRKLHSFRKKLTELNDSLTAALYSRDQAIKDLKESNDHLLDAHDKNVGLLAFIIKLTTNYLSSFENFRKTLLVKFRGKKTSEIESLLNNPDLLKNQYRDFYSNLDKTILGLFPNFKEEYNSVAPADQQITDEDIKNNILSTRMRIFGLRKLGINKSNEIAQMLNISIRTVYNNR